MIDVNEGGTREDVREKKFISHFSVGHRLAIIVVVTFFMEPTPSVYPSSANERPENVPVPLASRIRTQRQDPIPAPTVPEPCVSVANAQLTVNESSLLDVWMLKLCGSVGDADRPFKPQTSPPCPLSL